MCWWSSVGFTLSSQQYLCPWSLLSPWGRFPICLKNSFILCQFYTWMAWILVPSIFILISRLSPSLTRILISKSPSYFYALLFHVTHWGYESFLYDHGWEITYWSKRNLPVAVPLTPSPANCPVLEPLISAHHVSASPLFHPLSHVSTMWFSDWLHGSHGFGVSLSLLISYHLNTNVYPCQGLQSHTRELSI